MTFLLAFPSSDLNFFLVFVLLELDSDLSTVSNFVCPLVNWSRYQSSQFMVVYLALLLLCHGYNNATDL